MDLDEPVTTTITIKIQNTRRPTRVRTGRFSLEALRHYEKMLMIGGGDIGLLLVGAVKVEVFSMPREPRLEEFPW